MAIPSITPETINYYTSQFNSFGNNKLEAIWNKTHNRSDVLPPVQKDTACLMQLLIKLINPLTILEIGTGIGVSTLIIALSTAASARITTIERGNKFVDEAQNNFEQFDVADKINLVHGDAAEIIPQLKQEYDFIFQDSGKQLYLPTLNKIVTLLKPGGLLLVDDTLFPAMSLPERNSRSQKVINDFNIAVHEHPLLKSCILPIGHGITLAQKL